jgi:hypothetical protein
MSFIKHELLGIRFGVETRIKWMKKLKKTIMAMVGVLIHFLRGKQQQKINIIMPKF